MKPINLNQILKNTLLVVVIAVVVLGGNLALKWSLSLFPSRTINVSAEGKTMVSPDIAKISFSVVSEGSSPETLQMDNSKKMSSAIDFIKNQEVDVKDIKTINYNLSPRYKYNEARKQSFIADYILIQTTLVKIRDLNKVAKILGGLSELGVNQISSVSFEVDEPDKYLSEIRMEAFTKAHEKAATMAALNGVKIKRIINFSEYQNLPIHPYGFLELAEKNDNGAMLPAPPMEPGTEEITIQVNVTYEIE